MPSAKRCPNTAAVRLGEVHKFTQSVYLKLLLELIWFDGFYFLMHEMCTLGEVREVLWGIYEQKSSKRLNNPQRAVFMKPFIQFITWQLVPSLANWKDRGAVRYVISTGRETRFGAFPLSLSNAKFFKSNSQWWVWKFPLVVKFGKLPSVVPRAAQTWLWLTFFFLIKRHPRSSFYPLGAL